MVRAHFKTLTFPFTMLKTVCLSLSIQEIFAKIGDKVISAVYFGRKLANTDIVQVPILLAGRYISRALLLSSLTCNVARFFEDSMNI